MLIFHGLRDSFRWCLVNLNVTGSFADDIIHVHVVISVRYRLYG